VEYLDSFADSKGKSGTARATIDMMRLVVSLYRYRLFAGVGDTRLVDAAKKMDRAAVRALLQSTST